MTMDLECSDAVRVVLDGFIAIHYVGLGRNGYGFLGVLAPPNVFVSSPVLYRTGMEHEADALGDRVPLLVSELRLPAADKRPREVEVRAGHYIRVNHEITILVMQVTPQYAKLKVIAERTVAHTKEPVPKRAAPSMPSLSLV